MSTQPIFFDGVVLTQTADFVYADRRRFATLFAANPGGHRDALLKFVQALALPNNLVFSKGALRTEPAGQLRREIANASRATFQSLAPAPLLIPLRTRALALLRSEWQAVAGNLRSPEALRAVVGHIRRELHLFAGTVADKQYKTDHYIDAADSLVLPGEIERELCSRVWPVFHALFPKHTSKACVRFIRYTLTTHYRIAFEYFLTARGYYKPSLTRTFLAKYASESPRSPVLRAVTDCIALRVLRKVKSRDGIVDAALNWSLSAEGRRAKDSFGELEERLDFLEQWPQTKRRAEARIVGILDSRHSRVGTAALSALKLLAPAWTGTGEDIEIAEGSFKGFLERERTAYAWLWRFRAADAAEWIYDEVNRLART